VPGRDEEASAQSVRSSSTLERNLAKANREHDMLGVLGAGKRPRECRVCYIFATHEQSSKAGLNVSGNSLTQQGATRHFYPRGLGDLFITRRKAAELGLPQALKTSVPGGLAGLKLALAAPRFWGCSCHYGKSYENI
jgi:hypothetical protein